MDTTSTTSYDVRSGLERAWDVIAVFLPRLAGFLLILAIGYFVALAVGKAIDKVLARIGFDRWVERGVVKKAMSRSGVHASDIAGKLAFYTLFLFVLQMAFGMFEANPISALLTQVIAFLPNVFVAIAIVIVAAVIASGVRELVSSVIGGLGYGRLLADAAAVAVLVIGAFAALNQLGIAPQIVNGLFYAMLAIIVGVSIVAIGGGGIGPMRSRWESALSRLDREIPRIQDQIQTNAAMTPNAATTVPSPQVPAEPADPRWRPDQGGYVS